MKLFKRNKHGWSFNEGGSYVTACKMRVYGEDGYFYRLWLRGLELCLITTKGQSPQLKWSYRRVARTAS